MPAVIENGVGLMKRCRCAYSHPDTLASSAAYTNTTILSRAPSTPNASAISKPPRSARIARPGRESSRLCVDHNAPSAMTHIR